MTEKFVKTYLPLVVFPVLSALALKLTVGNVILSGLGPQLEAHCPPLLTSLELTPYRQNYTSLPSVDAVLCPFVAFFHFAFTQPVLPLLTYFLGTSLPLLALPALEAVRPGRPTVLALPVLMGLAAQVFTFGAVLPLYWAVFIVSGAARASPSPSSSSSTTISALHVQAISFGLLAGALVPSACLVALRDPHVTALWQLFPLWQFIAQAAHLLVRPPSPNNPNPKSQSQSPEAPPSGRGGFGWIQALYLASFIAGSSTHVATLFSAASTWRDVFLPSVAPRVGAPPELKVLDLLQWDVVFSFGSTLLATVWFARSRRQALAIVLWNIVGSVVVGPGAAIAAVALWRESYLHTSPEGKKGGSASRKWEFM